MAFENKIVLEAILLEYSILQDAELTILKQFISPTERAYNTFLVGTKDKIFVAKGITGQTASVSNLETEWEALKILDDKNVPKLIFPNHKPIQYLLIEYIEGDSAADLLTENNNPNKIFSLIGNALGAIHGTRVDHFGSLIDSHPIFWNEYVRERFSERIHGIKQIIDKQLFDKTLEKFHSLEHVLEGEDKRPPAIIHRDAYSENFIISKDFSRAILIDFAMAIGGRPLFDVAKFYTTELSNKPEYRDDFLDAYQKHIPRDNNFVDELTLYIILECVGFIGFNDVNKNIAGRDSGIEILKQTVGGYGVMKSLLT